MSTDLLSRIVQRFFFALSAATRIIGCNKGTVMASLSEESSDKSVVLSDELLKIFGTSAPGGDKQINSTKTNQVSTGFIYCRGDISVGGRFRTPVQAARGLIAPAGSSALPAVVIGNSGLYGSGGALGLTGGAIVGGPISTAAGNLVLNPTGPAIDFSGKTIINAAGGGIPTIGNPNEVIVNNAMGALSSEPALAARRGGLGIDTSALSGFPRVASGTWSIGALTGADFGGSLALDDLTVTNGITAGNIITSGAIEQQLDLEHTSSTYIGRVTTVDDAPETIIALQTYDRGAGSVYTLRGQVALIEQGTALTGSITFMARAKNLGGTASVSALIGVGKILEAPLTADVVVTAAGDMVNVRAVGPVGRTISWCARLDVVKVTL